MSTLPAAFADLQPYADVWALPDSAARSARRLSSTQPELETFYHAVLPRLGAIVTHLDAQPLDALPEADETLLRMLLGYAEIVPAVDFYGQPAVVDGFDSARVRAVNIPYLSPTR